MTLEKNNILSHNLTQRIVTAFIAIAVLLLVIYKIGSFGFLALILIFSTLTAAEISNMFIDLKKEPIFNHLILRLVSFSLILTLLLTVPSFNISQMIITYPDLNLIPLYLGLILIPLIYRKSEIQVTFDRLIVFLLVGLYAFFLPLKIFEIFNLDNDYFYFYFFGLLVFGTDTCAYIFGKLFGRKIFKSPFQPFISPSKTFEGFAGSLIWTAILIALAHSFEIFSFTAISIFLLFLTALGAISGDLVASLIKRKAQKKDSGHLFPGHGGIFDRLDSLLLSAPFFLIAAKYFTLL